MNGLLEWLEHRTGAISLTHAALYEAIPGGARWRYVWGSTLVFCFFVQVITGIGLWMCYSPGAQSAWGSVYYIQHEMQGGWLLRGIHHLTAQAMVVLLAVHLLQVVIDGAYRAPREVNFWLGLVLAQLVLGLALTGYLLPWDQKGYWATRVATNLMGLVPLVGPELQRLAVGGSEYGHHTLTRFFAMHAGVLPALLAGFLVLHVLLFRRHGLTVRNPQRAPQGVFWPDQVLRDGVACLGVAALVLFLVMKPALFDGARDPGHWGAELAAPADATQPPPFPRPEWYFLFLFQLLKYFPGEREVIGALVVPGLVVALLFIMPWVGQWRLGHRFNVAMVLGLLLAAGTLTGLALWEDYGGPRAAEFTAAAATSAADGHRAAFLAARFDRVPLAGAEELLRGDPLTQGPKLFARHCASCHVHAPRAAAEPALKKATAPNLHGFATREWIAGLLDPQRVGGPEYFGQTAHRDGEMVTWVRETIDGMSSDERKKLVAVAAALSAEAQLPQGADGDEPAAALVAEGQRLIREEIGCVDCHRFGDAGELGTAPDLTGYGSRQWLIEMIGNPGHERFYGERNDRMPAFAKQLTGRELELLADWLRSDWPR